MNLKQHPLSAAWPPLTEHDMMLLRASVKKGLLKRKVLLFEGEILDGWHLHLVCNELEIKPEYEGYKGDDPVGAVTTANDARRHATMSQRVHARVLMDQWAQEHPVAAGLKETGNRVPQQNSQVLPIALETGASMKTVIQSRKVAKKGTEALNKAVTDGDISVKAAAAIASLPAQEQDQRVEEIARGEKQEKPKIDSAKCPNRSNCDLQDRYDELADQFETARDMLKTEDAVLGTDSAKEMQVLRQEIRGLTKRRNELMARTVEMEKQIKWWRKTAEKLGWKPEKRA